MAINLLLDLEKEVIAYAATRGASLLPQVRPTQLSGLEINPYAQQLAQVVIWIGYLQWMHHNGFNAPRDPILEPIESIRLMDAILDLSDRENPKEPEWPAADFIVGNPPFLGGSKIRSEIGDDYVQALFKCYSGRIPAFSDLVCYWFEKSRSAIEVNNHTRVGLLATQSIRGGANRVCLDRICLNGAIFWAISDREWFLEGATVRVSIIAFDSGSEQHRVLDSCPIAKINADLTTGVDVTVAKLLRDRQGMCFMGASPKAPFDISESQAIALNQLPLNPHQCANSDVVRRVASGIDLTRRDRLTWTLDFGTLDQDSAASYEAPFEYIKLNVLPVRKTRRADYRGMWWQYARPRPELRVSLRNLSRWIATPEVAKHRIFVWVKSEVLCNQQTLVFASPFDYDFGVLHSRIHEVWSRAKGTQLREEESGFRYTPTTCFETFPFPEPTDAQREAIAAAAKELDTLRNNWLNPPEWTREEVLEFPGSIAGPWARYVHEPNAQGLGTVRYPRWVPKDAECAKKLAKRTLTNLYNERPTWLDLIHKRLDAAVFAAYGWPANLSDDDLLAKLLALNLERAAAQADAPTAPAEPEDDEGDENEVRVKPAHKKRSKAPPSAVKPASRKAE